MTETEGKKKEVNGRHACIVYKERFVNVTWINYLSVSEVFASGIDRRGHALRDMTMKQLDSFPLALGLRSVCVSNRSLEVNRAGIVQSVQWLGYRLNHRKIWFQFPTRTTNVQSDCEAQPDSYLPTAKRPGSEADHSHLSSAEINNPEARSKSQPVLRLISLMHALSYPWFGDINISWWRVEIMRLRLCSTSLHYPVISPVLYILIFLFSILVLTLQAFLNECIGSDY